MDMRPPVKRAFYNDDGGFSTVGMVLALLITLTLMFSSAQVYKIHSLSADVQNVADASALAAENQVASFYVAAQLCDCISLSLALTGIAVAGVGAVALCVPGGAGVAKPLLDAAKRILSARTSFVSKASRGLNTLQQLLPFIAAAEALSVAHANGEDHRYIAIALLIPDTGEEIRLPTDDGSEAVVQDLQDKQEEIAQAAKEAEQAAQRASEYKQQAFLADCGAVPDYCMEERAASLAGLSGTSNPHYNSVAAWSFSVALERARSYYPVRLANETSQGSSAEQQADSHLRARIYRFASEELERGYVREGADGSFEASFPLIPHTLDELKETSLYTEEVYPVTGSETGLSIMHAWSGCPGASGWESRGSGSIRILAEHAADYTTCPYCRFSAHSLSSVAAASTSTNNGFEHYYRIVADQAALYQEAKEKQCMAQRAVQEPVSQAFEGLQAAAKRAVGMRIHPTPPGSTGAIVVAANVSSVPVSSLFPNGFVSSGGSLGPRVALSAAVLGKDKPEGTENVLTSMLDSLQDRLDGSIAPGIPMVLDIWSAVLTAHARGSDAILSGIEEALDTLPLVSYSHLGTWAREKLSDTIESIGLEPADLVSYKPILANTYHVASENDSPIAQALLGAKSVAVHLDASAVNPIGAAIDITASYATEALDNQGDTIEIATIEFLGQGGPSVPIKIPLSPATKEYAEDKLFDVAAALKHITGTDDSEAVWE